MWLICAACSVVLTFFGWGLTVKENKAALFASFAALVMMAAAILMMFQQVLQWVLREDWSALMDVVPSAYTGMFVFLAVISLANLVPVLVWQAEKKEQDTMTA